MDTYKRPYKYLNRKFPGFIGLTRDQYFAVIRRDIHTAMILGLSFDDYMSLIDKNYPKR